MKARPVLFLDRDGILVEEDQVDTFEKIKWIPGVFSSLRRIRKESDFFFAMVSNQDGVGTKNFPSEDFWPVADRIVATLAGEEIVFDEIHYDFSMPQDNSPGRKPKTGMLTQYMNSDQFDLSKSIVIGDRLTDVELAKNLGCRAIWFASPSRKKELGALEPTCLMITESWQDIASLLLGDEKPQPQRRAVITRKTAETDIVLSLNIDGTGKGAIKTGLPFLDHMLDQIVRHGGLDLDLTVTGDLEVDEHHTVEDVALSLGQAFLQALGDKRGISRYGFEVLPMDDVLAQVALDFSGRPWFAWNVKFTRDIIGTFPTELFFHFFKSFSDEAKCNLNMQVSSGNAHHQAEALFKACGRAIKQAVRKYPWSDELPSTKGVL